MCLIATAIYEKSVLKLNEAMICSWGWYFTLYLFCLGHPLILRYAELAYVIEVDTTLTSVPSKKIQLTIMINTVTARSGRWSIFLHILPVFKCKLLPFIPIYKMLDRRFSFAQVHGEGKTRHKGG